MDEYVPVVSLWDLADKNRQKLKDVVKLDAGENQLGFSPMVTKTLRTQELFNFYPDPEYKELRKTLAEYTKTSIDNIMVESGSDEMLDLLFRLILEPGDKVINYPPTFGIYPVLTKLNKGQIVTVPHKADFSLDVDAVKKVLDDDEQTISIVICSPNNPTGTVSSQEKIVKLLKTGKLIIVDEAYYEFSDRTVVDIVALRQKNFGLFLHTSF